MAKPTEGQPPDFREDPDGFMTWANNTHSGVFGINENKGSLNGDNIVDMDIPRDTTDVSDTATILNSLLAALRSASF